MNVAEPIVSEVIPEEYRPFVDALIQASSGAADLESANNALYDFSEYLGIRQDIEKLSSSDVESRLKAERELLGHFHNNVELLVRKTWVEKADENLKEQFLEKVTELIAAMNESRHSAALGIFSAIALDLAYLLFGNQSKKEDFLEYAFRIESQIGLFWWFSSSMPSLGESASPRLVRLMVYAGISYIASL